MRDFNMKKDAYYFPHFSNARNDVKLLKLRRVLGLEGYGIYFCLLEILRDQTDFKYPLAGLSELEYELRVPKEKISTVIMDYGLFEVDTVGFFSPKLVQYLMPYLEKTERARNAANKRWLEAKEYANADANALQKDMQGEERKVEKKRVKKQKEIIELPFSSEQFKTAWNDFLQFRKEINKPIKSDTGWKYTLNMLSKYKEDIAIKMINQSIERGWQGIFELKDEKKPKLGGGRDASGFAA